MTIPQGSPQSMRVEAVVALHLWWRLGWRTWVAALVAFLPAAICFLGFAKSPSLTLFVTYNALLVPGVFVYFYWVVRIVSRSMFGKAIAIEDHGWVSPRVTRGDALLLGPLPLGAAFALLLALLWREMALWVSWRLLVLLLLLAGAPGPLVYILGCFIDVALSVVAFWWLIHAPYGVTRIDIESRGAVVQQPELA